MDRLWREIENPNGRENLMFTAGGVAAGKSTVVTDELVSNHDLAFDGTLRETDWAIKTIDRALQKGWDITINYIQRPIDLVIQGAIDRAEKGGRWGPISSLAETHQAAQNSILKIAKHFQGNPAVDIKYWLNDGESKDTSPFKISLADIDTHGQYSYHSFYDTRKAQSTKRSQRQSNHERFRAESRQSIVTRFTAAVESGNYSRDILSRIAQGDAELEGILKGSQAAVPAEDSQSQKQAIEKVQDTDSNTVHERVGKILDRAGDASPEQQQAIAQKIFETVDRKAAKPKTRALTQKGALRARHLFAEELTLTPEETKILRSPHEIMLVHDANGRLDSVALGGRQESPLPKTIHHGAILSHNHPGGRGPSSSDLATALKHPHATLTPPSASSRSTRIIKWRYSASKQKLKQTTHSLNKLQSSTEKIANFLEIQQSPDEKYLSHSQRN